MTDLREYGGRREAGGDAVVGSTEVRRNVLLGLGRLGRWGKWNDDGSSRFGRG